MRKVRDPRGWCASTDAFSSIAAFIIAYVPCVTWMAMVLVAVQYENTYEEPTKGRAQDESNSSLSR